MRSSPKPSSKPDEDGLLPTPSTDSAREPSNASSNASAGSASPTPSQRTYRSHNFTSTRKAPYARQTAIA